MRNKYVWLGIGLVALTISLNPIPKYADTDSGRRPDFSFTIPLSAQTSPQFNITQYRSAFAFEQLTVSNSAKTFTANTYAPNGSSNLTTRAEFAVLNCDDNGQSGSSQRIRYRLDGTNASATVGVEFRPATDLPIPGYKNISAFTMFREGSSDVVCEVHYYRFASNTP